MTIFQAHYYPASDRFLIATGVMNEHAPSSVIIWTAGGDPIAAGQFAVKGDENDQSVDGTNDQVRVRSFQLTIPVLIVDRSSLPWCPPWCIAPLY